jgi:hypothetical protein
MRTNVNIADDVREFAMVYADAKGITLGDAITELVREGQRAVTEKRKARSFARSSAGFPMFPRSGRKLTTEQVKKSEEDEID